jgi:hypothetical protein
MGNIPKKFLCILEQTYIDQISPFSYFNENWEEELMREYENLRI